MIQISRYIWRSVIFSCSVGCSKLNGQLGIQTKEHTATTTIKSKAESKSVNIQRNNQLIGTHKMKTFLTLMVILSRIQPGNGSSEIEKQIEKQKEEYNSLLSVLQEGKEGGLGEHKRAVLEMLAQKMNRYKEQVKREVAHRYIEGAVELDLLNKYLGEIAELGREIDECIGQKNKYKDQKNRDLEMDRCIDKMRKLVLWVEGYKEQLEQDLLNRFREEINKLNDPTNRYKEWKKERTVVLHMRDLAVEEKAKQKQMKLKFNQQKHQGSFKPKYWHHEM